MKRFLIIADDFTGANDSGVQLARYGIRTHVVFDPARIDRSPDSFVLDTESRNIPAEEAESKLNALLASIPFDRFDYVVKKVDSTLRGNIPYEVRAVDQAFSPDQLVFAPAFPSIGRFTRKGTHYLHKTPLMETEFAHDPSKPLETDSLPELMQEVYPVCTHINAAALYAGPEITDRLVSFFCTADKDFQRMISAVQKTGRKKVLWIGSAGICNALLNHISAEYPGVGLITSLSQTTAAQVKFAESNGVKVVKVPIHTLLQKRDDAYADTAVAYIRKGFDTLLISSATYDRNDLALSAAQAQAYGYDQSRLSELTQEIMSELMEKVLARTQVSGLFLSGGDTAIGFLNRTQAEGSDILGEVSNGIPIMRINGGSLDGLKVITKAGGFGNEDAILYALRKLKEKTLPILMR